MEALILKYLNTFCVYSVSCRLLENLIVQIYKYILLDFQEIFDFNLKKSGACILAKTEFSTFAAMFPSPFFPVEGPIFQSGNYRKLKTLKIKYFVLRGESLTYPACLEYYDKFQKKNIPKRRIFLRSCFSINKYGEIRHKYCIALNTMDDCFCFVYYGQRFGDGTLWLASMFLLGNREQSPCNQPHPNYMVCIFYCDIFSYSFFT